MKTKNIFRKRRLVQTMYLLTAFLVAALFFGSAASTGVAPTSITPNETSQTSETFNTGEVPVARSLGQARADHDLVIDSIDAPSSGNAGSVAPLVSITNVGDNDEYGVPLNVLIGKRQVSGTVEDFETTNGGYTASGTPSVIWEWGTSTKTGGPSSAHSGVKLWATDLDANYPASCNNKLDSALFVVPPYAELTFWHWYDTEASYDGANIKISTNGGSTWSVLTPAGGYTGTANSANPLYPEPIWTGHVQKFWEKETVDLSPYSGQNVKIRFHFGSDSSVQYPGWFIDDVGITSSSWLNEYNQTQYFDIASGDTIQVSMPSWTPGDMNIQENIDIDYLAEAEATLPNDATPDDNYLDAPFTLHFGYFHDVAITEIVSPTDGQAEAKTPEVVLANHGQNDESVDVNMVIEKAQYTLYLEEYFEGTFPPTGWTNQIIQNHGWLRNDEADEENYAGGQGYCADASADAVGSSGPWPMDCALISPSMDLSMVSAAIFSYTGAFNSLSGDYADVDISIDGGATWINLQHWTTDHSPSGPGEDVEFDISPYCGNPNVQIRFHYYADSWDWYYHVDNVKIYKVDFVSEYDETITVDITAGSTTNVVFPDWTPSDITLGFDLDYLVTATAALGGFNTIGSEGFEFYTAGHYEFPSGWTVTQVNPASTWFIYGTGTTHTSKCQETGSLNLAQNELLTSPSFNFAGMNTIKLQYSAYFYRAVTDGDSYVEVLGSLDGGVSWPQLIKTYTATGGVSYSEDIDISAWAANQPSVMIGYRFVSDADISLTDYFYFDNFWIGNAVSVATESFSSYTAGYYNIPTGWVISQTNPTSTWFIYGTGTTHTSKCQETGSLNLAQNEFLTSPLFNLGGMAVVKLQYSAYFYRAVTNGDSYVEVVGSIDGGVTWPTLIKTYTATGGVSYSEDIDVSAWAANQPSVMIGYRFVSDADVNLTDYFYFDNFWIGNEVTITTEGFNSYTPGYYSIPAGWTVTQTNPSTWFVSGIGSTHQMRCQETGSLNLAQNEFLTSPLFNLGGMAVVKLQYSAYFYRAVTNGDSYVEVVGSIDGGVTWPTLIKTYTATGGVSYSEDIDVSAWAANQPSVMIGYRFVSTADINLTDYFYFDNFWIGNEVPVITEYFNNFVPGYYNFPIGWTRTITNPTGKWWMYTSGTIVYPKVNESGSNGQAQDEWIISTTIDCSALSNVSLQFTKYFYKATTGGDSTGQVLGSIDGGATWTKYIVNYTATSSTAETRYITSWAAGQANVKIAFHFISTADATLTDYFYFDDFFVGVMWGPMGNSPPAGWTILNYGSQSPQVWDTNDWHRYSTSSYPAQGQFARVYYSPTETTQNELLISPSIDCTALTTVTLSFWHYWYRSSSTNQRGWVNGSTDGGVTFPYLIAAYTANDGPAIKTYDISSWAAGQSNVMIQYQYRDQSGSGYYWYVDDFKISSGTTTIYSQNFEGVGYFENFATNYVPASWGPLGWQVAPPGDTHWSVVSSALAGGAAPEARFYYSPVATGNFSLYSGPIDTSAYTALTLSFKHYVDWYANPFTLKVETSTDGTTWGTVWSVSPTADIPASTVVIPLSGAQGIGSATFRMRFTFSGYTNNIMYWYVDNVKLGTLVTVYTTTFNENWIPENWGPLGWLVAPPGDTHWSQSLTANAGGTSPELKFSYSPIVTGNLSFYSGPIDTSAYTTLTLSFKHYVNHYATPYTLKVETSSDGVSWGTVWSISPTATIPATTVVIPLTSTDGIGSSTFRMRFTFSGYTNNINYWYIDDVKLGTMVTIYTTTFNENWVPPSWGPLGWQVSPPEDTHWSQSLTANAGGTSPELKFSYTPSMTGDFSFYSGPIDTSAYTTLTLSFKHYVNHYTTPYTLKVETSSDGVSWGTVWSISPTVTIPATTVVIPLTATDGIGSSTFQMRFTYSGNTFNINYWYIDDVKLGTLITVYTTTFNENWIPTNWGPAGWQQIVVSGSDPDNEWDVVTTSSYPSGVIPHGDTHMAQYDSYFISSGNSARLYLPNPVDFSSIGSSAIQATMWMYHDTAYSSPPYDRVEVQVSLDGTIWNTVGSVDRYAPVAHWEEHVFDFSAYAGESTVYIGFLGISEYGNSIYIDDLSLEYYGVISDGNPGDNELVNWITLTYIHDTGVSAITEPSGPSGNWAPGTYAVAGVVNNFGSFTEYNILVNAKIWKLEGKDDILFYEENVTVSVLPSGSSSDVSFPDVTFENADEGDFKLEMKTILPGDDSPGNDKKTKTFVIQAPDTTPPETTAALSGTLGQNNWYISNVVVMLSATDPVGKSFKGIGGVKWPMGVNHTYYKVDAGDWTEYTVPIVVSSDGQHTVFFYSDDKAIPPNVEEEKNVSFKIDKAAPVINSYTATALNVMKNKWLLECDAEDAPSGIVLVEFYADDALVGSVTEAPYEFEVTGKIHTTQCIVYDAAGNSKMSDVVVSYDVGSQQQSLHDLPGLQQKQL